MKHFVVPSCRGSVNELTDGPASLNVAGMLWEELDVRSVKESIGDVGGTLEPETELGNAGRGDEGGGALLAESGVGGSVARVIPALVRVIKTPKTTAAVAAAPVDVVKREEGALLVLLLL